MADTVFTLARLTRLDLISRYLATRPNAGHHGSSIVELRAAEIMSKEALICAILDTQDSRTPERDKDPGTQ